MIAAWIALPLVLRFVLLTFVGLCSGALANYMIYTWAWYARPISPWAPKSDDAPERKVTDRIPIFGWLGLRRESEVHGKWFWIRPIFIELGLAISLPLLYWFESQNDLLLPIAFRGLGTFEPWGTHIFFSHAILFVLMVAATFIDFDEQTIPDMITVPGTIFALFLSCFSLLWFLPAEIPGNVAITTFSLPWAPDPKWLGKTGLWTGLAIWSGWCFALADRRLITRKGFAKAIEFFFAGLVRNWTWKLLVVIWIAGLFGIGIVHRVGGNAWHGLFTSLVGLAVGGGIVWAIRLVASSAMQVEAMGFGDVTLMAMIGAFVGWQAASIGFFLSPFTAIIIVIMQVVLTGERRIPFGPYLCSGTMVAILFWDRLFNGWFAQFAAAMAGIGIWMGVAIFGLMWIMLFVWRLIKQSLLRE